jgi:hypothetical protein
MTAARRLTASVPVPVEEERTKEENTKRGRQSKLHVGRRI